MEATNKDLERVYKKRYENPPKFSAGRPRGSKMRSKDEERFRTTYGMYGSEEQLKQFLSWEKSMKHFTKAVRNTTKEI